MRSLLSPPAAEVVEVAVGGEDPAALTRSSPAVDVVDVATGGEDLAALRQKSPTVKVVLVVMEFEVAALR